MGFIVLEPPLSRSILLCERVRFAVAGERLRKVMVVAEVESEPPPRPSPKGEGDHMPLK